MSTVRAVQRLRAELTPKRSTAAAGAGASARAGAGIIAAAAPSDATQQLLNANAADFSAKFAALKQHARAYKKASALGTHQLEWRREFDRLAQARKQLEHDLYGVWLPHATTLPLTHASMATAGAATPEPALSAAASARARVTPAAAAAASSAATAMFDSATAIELAACNEQYRAFAAEWRAAARDLLTPVTAARTALAGWKRAGAAASTAASTAAAPTVAKALAAAKERLTTTGIELTAAERACTADLAQHHGPAWQHSLLTATVADPTGTAPATMASPSPSPSRPVTAARATIAPAVAAAATGTTATTPLVMPPALAALLESAPASEGAVATGAATVAAVPVATPRRSSLSAAGAAVVQNGTGSGAATPRRSSLVTGPVADTAAVVPGGGGAAPSPSSGPVAEADESEAEKLWRAYHLRVQLLDDTYRSELDALRLQLVLYERQLYHRASPAAAASTAAGAAGDASARSTAAPSGGLSAHDVWDAHAAARFRKVARDAAAAKLTRAAYMSRLALEFPDRPADALVRRDQWTTKQRFVAQKRKALLAQWASERDAQQHALDRALADAAARDEQAWAAELARVAHDVTRHATHDALDVARAAHAAKVELLNAQKAARDARVAAERDRVAARVAAERAAQRVALAAYHSEQERERAVAAQRAAAQALRDAEQRAVEAVHNAARVEFRHDQALAKADEKRARDEALVRAELERFERLEALRATVAVEAARDPQRLLAPTAASAAAADATAAASAAKEQFGVREGFSDDQILSDKRLRLTLALRAAGLDHLPYAQQMIATTHGGKAGSAPPRRDAASTFQLGWTPAAKPQSEFF